MKQKFTKHILYNPHLEGIQSAIKEAGDDYVLMTIIPQDQYNFIAVFKRCVEST